ncbi:MAG: hypothetical protein MUO53_17730 [Maribacter sp.]|nr:hypothetical protein [Maribacter sp.]
MKTHGFYQNIPLRNGIILAMLIPAFSFGQVDDEPFKITVKDIDRIEREYIVAGTPYLDKEFKLGYWFLNGRKQKELAMRYDAYHDAIQFLQDDQKVFMTKNLDVEVHIEGKTYHYDDYLDHGNQKQGYFTPVNDGETLLYLRTSKTIKGPIKPENGYAEFKQPEFQTTISYYIKPKGKPAMPLFGLSRKEVFAVLWDKYSELRTYARSHKLNARNEAEVTMILAYYDQLKTEDRNTMNDPKND